MIINKFNVWQLAINHQKINDALNFFSEKVEHIILKI